MKNNKGFSLVELIVVIAIMAILAAVAVVGLSVYIPKAQQANDKQLVSDIEYALNLYYQGNSNVEGGYVILSPNSDAKASPEIVEAMEAVFGEEWEKELRLAYDGWSSNDLMNVVATYDDEAIASIYNSTFIKNPDGVVNAANTLLGIASGKIAGSSNAETYLNALDPTLCDKLDALELDPTAEDYEEQYGNAVSNLLVGYFADVMKPSSQFTPDESVEVDPTANISELAAFYAQVYAYCEMKKDNTLLDSLNEELQSSNSSYDKISGNNSVATYKSILSDKHPDEFSGLANYMTQQQGGGADDVAALKQMMEAVSVVANGYQDKESLIDGGLYSSPEVLEQVNSYVNAVKAKYEGRFPNANEVQPGDIVVILYADGSVACTVDLDK